VPAASRGIAVVWALALLLPTGATAHVPDGGGRSDSSSASRPAAGAQLAIDPSSWAMEDGANASFTAVWIDGPAGCRLTASWFRWSLGSSGPGGTLVDPNASEAELVAPEAGDGPTDLVVHSAAELRCGANETAVVGNASVNVTVAGPIQLEALEVEPDPVDPGEELQLVGNITGGASPYLLRIDWGDGNVSAANLSTTGPFAVAYRYVENGTFQPSLLATDAIGRTATGSPVEPAHVGGGFVSAIRATPGESEVGVPVTFQVALLQAPTNYSSIFWCDDASSTEADGQAGLLFGCAFDRTGTFQVGFEAVGGAPPYPATSSTFNEAVVAAPSLSFPLAASPGEVGLPLDVPVEIAGGVPPFAVRWTVVGTGATGASTEATDGSFDLTLLPEEAGEMTVSIVATDALGVAATTASEPVDIAPALALHAGAVAGVAGGEIALNVSASAVEGVAPYAWAIVPGLPAANGTNLTGELGVPGGFGWNATYLVERALEATVVAVDAEGAFDVDEVSLEPVAPLSVAAQASPAGPGEANLTFTASGGVAPYNYRWQGCSGGTGNGSVPSEGPVTIVVSATVDGNCSFALVVTDALGERARTTTVADLLAPLPPPAGAGFPGVAEALAASVLLAAGGTAALLWVRRRRPAVLPPPPDPVDVLHEVIEASDGVDRGLVELLAEERGVPLETIRTTLERLKADGTVRSGRGADGEEVLAWSPPPLR
jgi:hypothetical protein